LGFYLSAVDAELRRLATAAQFGDERPASPAHAVPDVVGGELEIVPGFKREEALGGKVFAAGESVRFETEAFSEIVASFFDHAKARFFLRVGGSIGDEDSTAASKAANRFSESVIVVFGVMEGRVEDGAVELIVGKRQAVELSLKTREKPGESALVVKAGAQAVVGVGLKVDGDGAMAESGEAVTEPAVAGTEIESRQAIGGGSGQRRKNRLLDVFVRTGADCPLPGVAPAQIAIRKREVEVGAIAAAAFGLADSSVLIEEASVVT